MKAIKFVSSEQIFLDELNEDWLTLTIKGEKYVFDADTLCDLSFAFAEALARVESGEEEKAYLCGACTSSLH